MARRKSVKFAPIFDDATPVAELWEAKEKRYARRMQRKATERWLPVTLPEHRGLPFLVAFFGDMHLDDDGCDVRLVRRDLGLVAKTDGAYGVHLGDATNAWVGRLAAEYAKQITTRKDSMRLVHDVVHGSGVQWLWWLLGNHDLWGDGAAVLGLTAGPGLYLPSWESRIELRAGRQSWRVHTAHDFKGSSDWNKTHGPLKAALKHSDGDLFVCGHRHTWGVQSVERSGKGSVIHVARARGYKFDDQYALQSGFPEDDNGACIAAIFDPRAKTETGRITVFSDLPLACEMLTSLRKSRAKRG